MRPHHLLVLAIALTASAAACGADSMSARQSFAAQLNGTWSQVVNIPGVSNVVTLAVTDTTIAGSGAYTIEAGRPGTFTASGVIAGSQVRFDLVRSDGFTQHFQGTLPMADLLTGISWFTSATIHGDPVSISFRRSGP